MHCETDELLYAVLDAGLDARLDSGLDAGLVHDNAEAWCSHSTKAPVSVCSFYGDIPPPCISARDLKTARCVEYPKLRLIRNLDLGACQWSSLKIGY